MMPKYESDIERKLVDMVKWHDGMCLKWNCPGWAGVPDRIALLPGGRITFVELKRPNHGRIAKRQEWWRDRLHLLGFDAIIIDDEADILEFEKRIEEAIG